MKIYNFDKINCLYVYGSIDGNMNSFIDSLVPRFPKKEKYKVEEHPKELERQEKIKKMIEEGRMSRFKPLSTKKKWDNCYSLNDSIIIVNGNCGFGTKKLSYFIKKLEPINTLLEENNSHLLFVRGNMDDPKAFEDEVINMSNIRMLQDYSVVKLTSFNCLCIGGSTSIDRIWKKKQEERIGNKLYFENEALVYDEKAIDEIINDYNIACIVSNTSPSFTYPSINVMKLSAKLWAESDKDIINDLVGERKIMDKIYDKLNDSDKKPYIWFYSRFGTSNGATINDISFKSMEPNQLMAFNTIVTKMFDVDLSKELGPNTSVVNEDFDSIGKKISLSSSGIYNGFRDFGRADMMDNPLMDLPQLDNPLVGEMPRLEIDGNAPVGDEEDIIRNEEFDVDENENLEEAEAVNELEEAVDAINVNAFNDFDFQHYIQNDIHNYVNRHIGNNGAN